MVAQPTRRTFLRHAGAGLLGLPALGTALSACGGDDGDARVSPDRLATIPAGGDAELLARALATEHVAIAAYNAGSPLLEGQALAAAQHFLTQERRHAGRLRELIRALGATPEGPRPSYDFGRPDRASDVLRLLQGVEQDSVAAYAEIVPRLADPLLRETVATIATNDAEHLALVRGLLGRQPVPTAFVTGAP